MKYDKLTNDCPKERCQPSISYAEILWQYHTDCLPYRAEKNSAAPFLKFIF